MNSVTHRSPRRVLSIRLIVTSAAVALISGAVITGGLVAERDQRRSLTREIENRLVLEARNLSLTGSDALLTDFPELTLHPLIKELQTRQPELRLVVVLDHTGHIQGHSDARILGTTFAPPDLTPEPGRLETGSSVAILGDADMLVARSPVTGPGGQSIGTVYVGLARSYIDGILARARREQMLVLAVVLVVGILASLVLMTLLLRPIDVLRRGIRRVGSGDLDTPMCLRNRTEFGLLADTVDDMAAELKQAQIQMVEKERLAHELQLAHEIQNSLLPKQPTRAGGFLVAGSHRAAAEVGGDYYDVLPLADGRWAVAVADVAGKGLAGCLVMSMLSALLRALRHDHDSPAELLVALDARLAESLRPGTFVTMFYGILDPRSGSLVFASAGHNPTLLNRASTGTIDRYASKGIPLAAVRGGAIRATLKDEHVVLGPGDMLIQYTDGLNEAFESRGEEQFGLDRLSEAVTAAARRGGDATLKELRTRLDAWTGGGPRLDDETALVVSREIAEVETASAPAREPGVEVAADWDPLNLLGEARRVGSYLPLAADLAGLGALREWVLGLPGLRDLEVETGELVRAALYEAAANIIEHGYNGDRRHSFEVWWVTGADTCHLPGGAPRSRGYFLLLDHGARYSADNWMESDFSDPDVRRRGRGFGLDIIHRAMARVGYYPGTAEGNVTVLMFDGDALADRSRELRHA